MRRLWSRYSSWRISLGGAKRLAVDVAAAFATLSLIGVIFVQGWCWGLWFKEDVFLTALLQCRACSAESERSRWAPAQVLVSACLQPFLVSVSPNQEYAAVKVLVARWPTPSLLPVPWSGKPDQGKVGRFETRVYSLRTMQYDAYSSGGAIIDNGMFLTTSPQPLSNIGGLPIIPVEPTLRLSEHESWVEGVTPSSELIDRVKRAEYVYMVTYFLLQIDPAEGQGKQGFYGIFLIDSGSVDPDTSVLGLDARMDPATLEWFRQNNPNVVAYNMDDESTPRVWGGGYRYLCCNSSGGPSMLFNIRFLPYFAPVLADASATK